MSSDGYLPWTTAMRAKIDFFMISLILYEFERAIHSKLWVFLMKVLKEQWAIGNNKICNKNNHKRSEFLDTESLLIHSKI